MELGRVRKNKWFTNPFESDEAGKAKVNLKEDYGDYNFAGRDEILNYLLTQKKTELKDAIKSYNYQPAFGGEITSSHINLAHQIIEDVLGGSQKVIVRDKSEACYLLESFATICAYEEIAGKHGAIINLIKSSATFPEKEIKDFLNNLNWISRSVTFTNGLIDTYRDMWTMYNAINPMLISKIREEMSTIIAANGVKCAMLKMSNTQFKEFVRLKMPGITNSQMASVIALKNKGEFSNVISEIANPEKLGTKDFERIFGKLDDLDIFNLTQNTTNFKTVTEAVKKTAERANKISNIADKAGKVSNFVNLLILTETVRTGKSVSPADILSVIPHPAALLAYWIETVIDNQEIAMNEAIWDVAPNWKFVVEWDEKWRGKSGIPDETLYIYYTDTSEKCNPEKIPTSIVIKDKQLASSVFGFTPKYVDFDIQSKIFKKGDDKIFFKPTKQVAY